MSIQLCVPTIQVSLPWKTVVTGWESSDLDLPASGINSVYSDLTGGTEIPTLPCDSRYVNTDTCQSNSNVVSTGILGSDFGRTRFNSQITSNCSGWSRKRRIPNGFRRSSMDLREFGIARKDENYAGNSSVVNSSSAPVKCFKNKTRYGDNSARNKESRDKPVGYKTSDFVQKKIGTRARKQGTNAPLGIYMENPSVTGTMSTCSLPRNQFSFGQWSLSSGLPYAAYGVPYRTASAYKMSDRIYMTCGQEAATSPICSLEQQSDISGVHCLPVPIQSSATGYLTWEGSMYGTYQPYYFDAFQPLATPEWYSYTDTDLNAPQWEDRHWNYGHDMFPYGLYHFGSMLEYGSQNPQSIPQSAHTSYVPLIIRRRYFL
uniref:Uncharacterized protein n=1 Tax=Arundo donax TaxID=35708 RepID=A0A0A9DQX1_ARUDO